MSSSRRIGLRPHGLSLDEEQFAQWAETQGLITMFDTVYPDDGDDFSPYETIGLAIESKCDDGRMHAWCIDLMAVPPEEAWPLMETTLRSRWRLYLSERGLTEVEEVES